jgi:hypothetical protein
VGLNDWDWVPPGRAAFCNRARLPAIEQLGGIEKLRFDPRGSSPMSSEKRRGFFRAFLDFFILFSGVSTASNLARTQGRPLLTRGLFLFRSRKTPEA